VLVLLIVSVAVHVSLIGPGCSFGAEGSRTPAFTDMSFEIGETCYRGKRCRRRRQLR
jgi:hypothetical protein